MLAFETFKVFKKFNDRKVCVLVHWLEGAYFSCCGLFMTLRKKGQRKKKIANAHERIVVLILKGIDFYFGLRSAIIHIWAHYIGVTIIIMKRKQSKPSGKFDIYFEYALLLVVKLHVTFLLLIINTYFMKSACPIILSA